MAEERKAQKRASLRDRAAAGDASAKRQIEARRLREQAARLLREAEALERFSKVKQSRTVGAMPAIRTTWWGAVA